MSRPLAIILKRILKMIAQTGFSLLILILQSSSPEPFYVWRMNFCLCQVSRNERIVSCNQVACVKASDVFLFVLGSHAQNIFGARFLIMQPLCQRIFKSILFRNLRIVFSTRISFHPKSRQIVVQQRETTSRKAYRYCAFAMHEKNPGRKPGIFQVTCVIFEVERVGSNTLSEFISIHQSWKKLYLCCTNKKARIKNPGFSLILS